MIEPAAPIAEARALVETAIRLGIRVATAESCTGGLIAGAITEIPGSSAMFDCGFVTYANEAKTRLIGVSADLIARHSAVSREVAIAMADGALTHSGATLAVGVTGIAGPGGGSPEKPIGLVHFAVAQRGRDTIHEVHLLEDRGRASVRLSAVQAALRLLLRAAWR